MILDTERNSRINVHINQKLKAVATKKLATHGITLPQAINILCANIANYDDYSVFGSSNSYYD